MHINIEDILWKDLCVTNAVDPSWGAVPVADSRKRGEGCCLSQRLHLPADLARTLCGETRAYTGDFILSSHIWTVFKIKYRGRAVFRHTRKKTGSRNHPTRKNVYYSGSLPLRVPSRGSFGAILMRTGAFIIYRRWHCLMSSHFRDTLPYPDNTVLNMVNIFKQQSGSLKETCGITKIYAAKTKISTLMVYATHRSMA